MVSLYPVKEIIVSDDSTGPESSLMVKSDFPNVTLIQGPRRGLGANRNRVLEHASGQVLVFLDDDATLSPDFVACAVDAFRRSNGRLAITILTGFEMNGGREIRSNDVDYLGFQSRPYRPDEPLNTIVINSAAIPVTLAKKLGFDELLWYGYDEVDFAMRARAAGANIIFCPALKNEHFPSDVNRNYYSPFIDASRVYVAFKRYWMLEKNSTKAVTYLVVASVHLLCANIKRFGWKGVRVTFLSLWKAYGSIWTRLTRLRYVHLDAGT